MCPHAMDARVLLQHRIGSGAIWKLAKKAQEAGSWTGQGGDVVKVQAADELRHPLEA